METAKTLNIKRGVLPMRYFGIPLALINLKDRIFEALTNKVKVK